MEAQVVTIDQPFHSAYEKFIAITDHRSTEMAGDKTHSEIEAYLETDGRELLRLLLQDHLDNQGSGRVGNAVCGADGVEPTRGGQLISTRCAVEPTRPWLLASVAEAGGRQGRQDVL